MKFLVTAIFFVSIYIISLVSCGSDATIITNCPSSEQIIIETPIEIQVWECIGKNKKRKCIRVQ